MKTHRQVVSQEFNGHHYYRLYKGLIGYKGLSVMDSLLFTHLNDFYDGKLDAYPDLEWFYCTAKQIIHAIEMPETSQKRSIKKLQEAGLIDIKVKGCPPKRYFLILPEGIEAVTEHYKKRLKEEREFIELYYQENPR
jgi:hypothetical protein